MTDDSPPAGRGFPFGKLVLGFAAGLALTLAFGVGALVAYQGQYADRIYPGVAVDGVDVSGLTRAAAAERLKGALAGYAGGTAVLAIDGNEATIPYAALGRRADVEALVDLAWSVGRDEAGALERAAEGVRSLIDGTLIEPAVLVDPDAVEQQLSMLAYRVDRAPVDGTATVTDEGFATTPAVAGSAVPQAEISAELLARLADPEAPDTLELSYATDPVEPAIDDADVAAAIEDAERMAADLEVTHGKESWTVKAATVRSWITFAATDDGYAATVAPTAPTKSLKALAKKVNKAPREASFSLRSGGSIGVVAAKNGRSVDVAASAPVVAQAVAARADETSPPAPVTLAMKVTKPELSTEEARKLAPRMRKISTWTTYYEVSERNGYSNNISIPARDLNGVVVGPGEVFDFWQSIGPVTAARGYRYGGAIINGRSQPTGAFAGGICSTSTTLFNAVVRAGYKMLSRHNHYYYISRYPTGLDATVAIEGNAVTTMSWKNDSKYPVMIRSAARPGVVTFSLYTVAVNNRRAVGGGSRVPGSTNLTYKVANGRTVTFRTSPKRNYNAATSSTQRTTSLRPGQARSVEIPVDGFDVTVTRVVKDHGKVILRNTWNSHYARVNGLTLVGARS